MVKRLSLLAMFMVLLAVTTLQRPKVLEVHAQDELAIPVIAVAKYADKEIVRPGDVVTIIIKVENLGNSTALNVTLRDTPIPEWVGVLNGTTDASWPSLAPNETVYHVYKIRIENIAIGTLRLSPAKVTYYDKQGQKYEVTSNELVLRADIRIRPAIDWDSLWNEAILLESAALIAVLSVLIYIEVRAYRRYKLERESKPRT